MWPIRLRSWHGGYATPHHRHEPTDTAYRVRVQFPAGLLTSTGQQLPFRNGLTATGEIITEDTRLIEKIFYELRRLKGR